MFLQYRLGNEIGDKLTFDKLGAANNRKIAAIVPPAKEL